MPRSAPRAYRITPRAKPPKKPTAGMGTVAVGDGGGSGTPPTQGQTLVWNATLSQWEAGSITGFQPARSLYWFREDFVNVPVTSLLEVSSGAGASSNTTVGSGVNHTFGTVRSTTGTTATGATSLHAPIVTRLGNTTSGATFDWTMTFRFNIPTLSTSGERYQLLMGFMDNWTGVDQANGVYVLYDEGGVSTGSAASANWQCVTASASTRTFTTSGIAVATGWQGEVLTVNSTATSATFTRKAGTFSSALATITTNIPESASVGFGWLLIKSVGTTARTVDFDFVDVYGAAVGTVNF